MNEYKECFSFFNNKPRLLFAHPEEYFAKNVFGMCVFIAGVAFALRVAIAFL